MNIQDIEELAKSQNIDIDESLKLDYPVGTMFWCIHHAVIVEPLEYPLVNRLEFILKDKPAEQRAIRLQALRPVRQPKLLPEELLASAQVLLAARQRWHTAMTPESASESLRANLLYERAVELHHARLAVQWKLEYHHPAFRHETGLVMPAVSYECPWSRVT